jgi:hypothetical protein
MNHTLSNSELSEYACSYNMDWVPETSCRNVQAICHLYRLILKVSLITCNSTTQILGETNAIQLLKNSRTLTELQRSKERSSVCWRSLSWAKCLTWTTLIIYSSISICAYSTFSNQTSEATSNVSCASCNLRLSSLPYFDHPYDKWWIVQIK